MTKLTLVIKDNSGLNTEAKLRSFFRTRIRRTLIQLLLSGSEVKSYKVCLHGPFDPSPKIIVEVDGPFIGDYLPVAARIITRANERIREYEVDPRV